MNISMQVRQRGTLTLPIQLRNKYNIQQGDTYHLVDIDGLFVLSPVAPIVPELAREITKMRIEAGYTTEDLLLSLREERERYYLENYADFEQESN